MFLKARLSPYGRAAIAIWPDNTAKVISGRCRISIRNANQIISGERKVSTRALLALMQEVG